LNRIGKLAWSEPIAMTPSPETGYRMRARLHLRDGVLGFFKEGTHVVCEARNTRQLLPETSDVLEGFAAAWARAGMGGDAELEVSENASASERVLHLDPAPSRPIASPDWARGLPGLTGFTVTDAGGARVVEGSAYVHEHLTIDGHSLALRRHVLAFFQGNRHLLEPLVQRVAGEVARDDTVMDLYAGVGLFSVAAASRGARVVAVEGDRVSAADLEANARALGGACEPVHRAVEDFLTRRHEPPRVLIVDPPRTGMSKEALAGAIALEAGSIVYVSCDVATFARDARRLVDAGYTLARIEGVDLFPNTPHVETIAVFQR
jgi:23S rRNA (uracil1939-C5)-methyltransferase